MKRLSTSFNRDKLEVIGIALSEQNGADGLRKWCSLHGVTYRQALATDAIREAFGHIDEVPVSILIDSEGKIVRRWEGERDFRTFNLAVKSCLTDTRK